MGAAGAYAIQRASLEHPRYGAAKVAVARMLVERGYEQFLPLRRNNRAGRSNVDPLFPGYLFCRLDLSDRPALAVTIPGVIGLVGVAGKPAAAPDSEMASLIGVIESTLPNEDAPFFLAGQKVRILSGPLRGVERVLSNVTSQQRLVVSVTLLQRAISVEIERAWTAAITGYRRPTPAIYCLVCGIDSPGDCRLG